MGKARETSIDVFRMLIMFGICLLHAIGFGMHGNEFASSALYWCVPAFVFISGWYGISFRLSKFVRLFATGVFCGGLAVLIGRGLGVKLDGDKIRFIIFHQWYVCAYLLLMLLAPFVNNALRQLDRKAAVNIFAAVFLLIWWNWLGMIHCINPYVPWTSGMGAYTVVMMLEVYVFARVLRHAGLSHVRAKIWLLPGFFLVITCGWRLLAGVYSSPFAIVFAGFVFLSFKGWSCGERLGKFATLIVPSLFPVYILHSQQVGADVIRQLEGWFDSIGLCCPVGVLLTAVIVFCACCAIDLPRRIFCFLFRNQLDRLWDWVDNQYEVVVLRVAHLSVRLVND